MGRRGPATVGVIARPFVDMPGIYARVGKRAVDITAAAVLLLVVAPLLLALMLAVVATSREPALFRQTRVGRDGVPFEMLKLRTMAGSSPDVEGDTLGRWHQMRDDAGIRVTPLGRLLRALSLDELPQLVNVLRGDMALVGPRPELPSLVESYEAWQHARHRVRPGLTGPWQVSPHRNEPMVLHLDYDLDYARDVRFGRDVRLLLRTVPAVVGRCGGRLGS